MIAASDGVSRLPASVRPDRYSPICEAISTIRRTRVRTRSVSSALRGMGSGEARFCAPEPVAAGRASATANDVTGCGGRPPVVFGGAPRGCAQPVTTGGGAAAGRMRSTTRARRVRRPPPCTAMRRTTVRARVTSWAVARRRSVRRRPGEPGNAPAQPSAAQRRSGRLPDSQALWRTDADSGVTCRAPPLRRGRDVDRRRLPGAQRGGICARGDSDGCETHPDGRSVGVVGWHDVLFGPLTVPASDSRPAAVGRTSTSTVREAPGASVQPTVDPLIGQASGCSEGRAADVGLSSQHVRERYVGGGAWAVVDDPDPPGVRDADGCQADPEAGP